MQLLASLPTGCACASRHYDIQHPRRDAIHVRVSPIAGRPNHPLSEQTFDAAALQWQPRPSLTVRAAWIDRVHRVSGDDAIDPLARERDLDTQLLNLAWKRGAEQLAGYAATVVYVVLGEPREAMLLGASVLLVIGLTIYQEQKSEHALQAPRDLSSPRARVMRDGDACMLAAADLVIGDVIVVAEGDRVPADARVIEETDLHADESLLTGESVPARRGVEASAADETLLHASTLVVRGHGVAEVVAIGSQTAVGKIGVALRTIHVEPTPMQLEIRRVVVLFAWLALTAAVFMAGLFFFTRGGWIDAILAGLTLAIAMIPEEFPVVLAVFLALGAWRLAKHQALVRRTPAIEALGAITVLCTDKTGTLIENRMAVADLVVNGERAGAGSLQTPALRSLLETAVLASRSDSHDPMDRALSDSAARIDATPPTRASGQHICEHPLSPQCPAVAYVWRRPDTELLVACKGAPEMLPTCADFPPTNAAPCLPKSTRWRDGACGCSPQPLHRGPMMRPQKPPCRL